MNYTEWAKAVPQEITDDALWTVEAYRLGLFVADVGWQDVTKLMQDKLRLLTQVIRLLLTMIPQQRGRILKEEGPMYRTGNDILLTDIPMPDVMRDR